MPPRTDTQPVFILGSPRSGTSVLAWALAQHDKMWTGPEADFHYYLSRSGALEEAWTKATARTDGWLAVHQVGRAEFMAAIGLGIDRLFLSRSGGKRWVDSTPANSLVGPQLAELFPGARFLHVVRDGRAVVASMLNSGFNVPFSSDFACACQTWVHFAGQALKFERLRPQRVLQVRQEQISSDAQTVMDCVQRFCALKPADGPAQFLQTNRINSSWGNKTAQKVHKAKPSSVPPVEPWRGWTRSQEATFHRVAGPLMAELGYAASKPVDEPVAPAHEADR